MNRRKGRRAVWREAQAAAPNNGVTFDRLNLGHYGVAASILSLAPSSAPQ